jgi:hypothetical protein
VTNSNITFQANTLSSSFAVGDTLPSEFAGTSSTPGTVYIDPQLISQTDGIDNLSLSTNGMITVKSGTTLTLAPGGSLSLLADIIKMEGSISAPSGTVSLKTTYTTTTTSTIAGEIKIGADASPSTISTRGSWVNESSLQGVSNLSTPQYINGGSITIKSGGNLDITAGSVLDASAGALLSSSNKVTGGNGGAITLSGNFDQATNPYVAQLDNLNLYSYGVAGGKGGALTISAGDIVIGGTASNALSLSADFFSTGGFSSYTLNSAGGLNGILVEPNTTVVATSQTLVLNATDYKQASGSNIYNFSTPTVLPDWERIPVNVTLNLNANPNNSSQANGSLIVGEGATIKVDPTATIKLWSDTQLTVLGTLDAPAGTIDLELNTLLGNGNVNFNNSSIWLGSQSELLSTGVTKLTPSSTGLTQGQVLNGGTVKINSNMFVVAQQGSLIDVSGTSTYLDLPTLSSGVQIYQKGLVAGNAGSVNISATEGVFLDGTMKAGVDTSTAQAGSFSLALTPQSGTYNGFRSSTWELYVQSSGSGTFVSKVGDSVATSDFTNVEGMAYVDASALKTAGFDQITLTNSNLNGLISFADQTTLQARQRITLDAPIIELTGNSGSASVNSAYVNLANSNVSNQTATAPAAGSGEFTVSAQLVDLTGNISVSGINQLAINSAGDIRLNGVLNSPTGATALQGSLSTQGAISLQANQVYPTTMSQFSINSSTGEYAAVAVNTAVTASVTSGNIVNVADTSKLAVGDSVSGDGFPAGTIIKSISNGTTFVTSLADTNATATGASLQIASGRVVAVADTSNLAVGESVTGGGFPAGTVIASITNGTTFVTSLADTNTTANSASTIVNGNLFNSNLSGGLTVTAGDISLGNYVNANPTGVKVAELQVFLPTNTIQIKLNNNAAGVPTQSISPVMSAGGQVTLNAATIDQGGVLKAPMGSIALNGSQSVKLDSGSLTSVSADGEIIPFGSIQGGSTLVYNLGYSQNGSPNYVTISAATLPTKQINISGNNIAIANEAVIKGVVIKAAVVDLSGGGDLYTNEFIPGSGGAPNVLDPTATTANTFAIIPGISTFAPYDPQLTGQYNSSASKSVLTVGETVYLAGGNGLSAGYYALLPASYALLPGAYRINLTSGYQDMSPSQPVNMVDGSQIIAGKLGVAGTDILSSRWSGFTVETGAMARTQSQYQDSYASSFFATQAAANGTAVPLQPQDAGQLVVTAIANNVTTPTLSLNGTFAASPGKGGVGAQVDLSISGGKFEIVNGIGADNGYVQLDSTSLTNMDVNSLLIGGVRGQPTTQTVNGITTTTTPITVGATDVLVNNAGSVLSGPEIILAGTNSVTVASGSSIQGAGTFAGQANNLAIGNTTTGVSGDGALLRVSSGPKVAVTRANLGTATPFLSIVSGATVGAQNNAVLLDSSYKTTVDSSAILTGQSLSVAAQNIDVGTNPNASVSSPTLALSGTLLTQALAFNDLTLHSYNGINFYASGNLDGQYASTPHVLSNLVLNSSSLNGFNASGSNSIYATNVTLTNTNTSADTSTVPAYSAGSLTITGNQITLAGGSQAIQGFDKVTFNATKQIIAQGTGSITIDAKDTTVNHDLVLQAGQITAGNNASLTITASNEAVSILPVAGATASATSALNAKLSIVGGSIADSGIIDLPSGSITLHATTGDVTLASGSITSAKGLSETISGQTVYANAGTVGLTSDSGAVNIKSGALVDVSGASDGGNAGSINVSAIYGTATVAGNLQGSATANFAGGSFALDANTLGLIPGSTTGNSLTDLNATLTTGGFTTLRDIRVRTGDLIVAPGTVVQSQTFNLTADTGAIDVFGTINASGTNGGNILLAANGNVTLESGSLLDTHATSGMLSNAAVATTNGVTTVTVASTANLAVGELISGDGFPSGTVITSITNGTTFVTSNADTNANATGVALQVGNSGGNVALETTTGAINMMKSAAVQIDVRGGNGGKVLLRALQTNGGTDLAVNVAKNPDGTSSTGFNISTGANVSLEGFKVYNNASLSKLAPTDVSGSDIAINSKDVAANTNTTSFFYNDAQTFANNAGAIQNRLGIGSNISVIPGIEIDSVGNLTLKANWDLSAWHFNSEPGVLTLRAAGNLNFGLGTTTASLTDGFTANTQIKSTTTFAPTGTPSWSYRLVAGADSTSADVMAVNNTIASAGGNVVLVSGSATGSGYKMEQISTGTGFIDIAAGGSLTLGNEESVIYTAGQLATGIPVTSNINKGTSLFGGTTGNYYYGVNGGDINIQVDGNVNGAATDQLITAWQWRPVNKLGYAGALQGSWWIDLGSFRQNIGALGGGNVSVTAGGEINNLSVVVPTTGYADSSNTIHVLGGGNLNVTAGGNINSGIFYVGNGQGTIVAGGDLGATPSASSGATARVDSTGNPIYTILALGQGNFDVSTGGDLTLQTVLNPTALSQATTLLAGSKTPTYFFTYGDTSGITLSSLGGNVKLKNDTTSFTSSFNLNSSAGGIAQATVYPGSLQVTALDGSITVNPMTLFPSANGNLNLVAAADINLNSSGSESATIVMSNNDPATLQANSPVSNTSADKTFFPDLTIGNSIIHALDANPAVIAAGGSIFGDNTVSLNSANLVLPKAVEIQAGQDVQNLSLSVQNQNSTDTTSIVAGRDIVFTATDVATPGINVAGPGQVILQAGRNVNLGESNGVTTNGNLANYLLPAGGASVTVLAGVGQGATDTQAFIDKYINPGKSSNYNADLVAFASAYGVTQNSSSYADLVAFVSAYGGSLNSKASSELIAFVSNNGAPANLSAAQAFTYFVSMQDNLKSNFVATQNISPAQAFADFNSMQNSQSIFVASQNTTPTQAFTDFTSMQKNLQASFVNQVFFDELAQSGTSAVTTGNYQQGYAAIATLFPTTNSYLGDINLYYSQIKTESGGAINLLTPGGSVNAGLANPSSSGPVKTAAQLGVVTVSGGDVNAFVNTDFTVNQSRVFTLQGGDILMWSSYGNIDAGKGSKTVSSTPPPLLVVDPKTGSFTVDATQSVVGSGIRVLLANPDVVPGNVELIAPVGTVNAGDAGIGSAGNITIAALHVVGADNINFGGTSAGVPTTVQAPVSVSMGSQDASKAAEQSTQSINNLTDLANAKDFKPTFLSVDVFVLGDGANP